MGILLLAPGRSFSEEVCIASTYNTKDKDQNGDKTTSGIPLDDLKLTFAHRTYEMKTWWRLTNRKTGKVIEEVYLTDRGPFVGKGRCVDLSAEANRQLGCDGLCEVKLERSKR